LLRRFTPRNDIHSSSGLAFRNGGGQREGAASFLDMQRLDQPALDPHRTLAGGGRLGIGSDDMAGVRDLFGGG